MTDIPGDDALNLPHYLWAIDFESPGAFEETGVPVAAHLIVTGSPAHDGPRVTACGMTLTRESRPRGWWLVPRDALPLAEVKLIHCGLDHIAQEIAP